MQYSIVFNGKIRPGATLEEARGNLAEMFKLRDPAVLDRVFSGQNVILKKGLSEDEARNQEMILYMAGAVCELRSNAPPAPPPPPEMAAEPAIAAEVPAPAAIAIPLASNARSGPSDYPQPAAVPASISTPGSQPLAAAVALTLAPEPPPPTAPADYMPAALRGHVGRDAAAEEQARNYTSGVTITNHGRDGEGYIDPMQAPWDPAFLPEGARGLCWGGLFSPLLWGTFNGMRLSFLPLIGIRVARRFIPLWAWVAFILAFGGFYLVQGRELAWQNKQWRNAKHFNRVQRWWTIGGSLLFVLFVSLVSYGFIVERQAARMIAAATVLATAEEKVERADNPDARSAAVAERARARTDYLAAIPDAATREEQRSEFAKEDREEEQNRERPAKESGEADAPPPSE